MSDQNYDVERDVAAFFTKTTVTRDACDLRAKEIVTSGLQLVPTQGACSYTVYGGTTLGSVIQFRLKSVALPLKTMELARQVYGKFAPKVALEGQIGDDDTNDGREALVVYVMPRMQGISRLDFILAHGYPKDTQKICDARLTLIKDVATFFALSWKAPQILEQAQLHKLEQEYEGDLRLLQHALPRRYQSVIQRCLQALPSIMALPIVLAHKDFGDFNMLVDPDTCHLLGVIDWAEAKLEPFGVNLYAVEKLMTKFHLRNGASRYPNYDTLYDTFWQTLKAEINADLSDATVCTIRSAILLGFLLEHGFTSRLANMPEPVPISNDNTEGAYKMLELESFLIQAETRFPFLASAD
ncbi:hypothetical protein CBER1_11655 [Cercospora berteroae]|uniref:Aminoglycoside phosphotransferase domain-containing protein n=1 Tax=Cercospora berteroae TaxID=357750 RepID=A0A2S6BZN6_9PEZI|nr:hypothetical protein CBER1_11655 [Cercospora berteroae]